MKLFYDFHIHSALSPCADDDMTPNNIVNMILLKELDAIAVTDHNCISNLAAFNQLTRDLPILFIPGIEVQTKEDIHVICLFESMESIVGFYEDLKPYRPEFPHNSEKFGHQIILDSEDRPQGEESFSLLFSMSIGINDLNKLVSQYDGLFIPAHIGRPSYSILSQLGFIPPELEITTIEINGPLDRSPYSQYQILVNSDAHQLGDIHERTHYLDVERKDIQSIFNRLRKQTL
jgi:hypothetical protein